MHIRQMTGLDQYLRQRFFEGREMIFRGVPDSSFQLIPSIGRRKAQSQGEHSQYELAIFKQFKQRAIRYITQEPRSDFEWLFLAQHYGIPTRLLDWTSNPLIALYFACEALPDRECAVYKITMNKWLNDPNEISPFDIVDIFGVEPRHTDIRYINQAGAFTIHPNPTEPMQYPGMAKYIFSPEIKKKARWQLRKLGINASLIYPSLESIARDIISEHEWLLQGGLIETSGNLFEP